MSPAQIQKLVRTASPEELEQHIWAQQVALMETIEWVQSNYPGIKIPDFLMGANREVLRGPENV